MRLPIVFFRRGLSGLFRFTDSKKSFFTRDDVHLREAGELV
jgi:hypothetical protein